MSCLDGLAGRTLDASGTCAWYNGDGRFHRTSCTHEILEDTSLWSSSRWPSWAWQSMFASCGCRWKPYLAWSSSSVTPRLMVVCFGVVHTLFGDLWHHFWVLFLLGFGFDDDSASIHSFCSNSFFQRGLLLLLKIFWRARKSDGHCDG